MIPRKGEIILTIKAVEARQRVAKHREQEQDRITDMNRVSEAFTLQSGMASKMTVIQSVDMVPLATAAELLGVSLSTLQTQLARGRLRGHKPGREWFVSYAELERYIAESLDAPGRKAPVESQHPK